MSFRFLCFTRVRSSSKCGRSSSSRTSSVISPGCTSHTSFGTSRFLNRSTVACYYPNYFPILSNEGAKRFSHNIFSNLTKCGRSSSSRTSSVTSHTSFGTSRFLNHSTAAFYYPSYYPILLSNEGSKLFSHNIFLILSK